MSGDAPGSYDEAFEALTYKNNLEPFEFARNGPTFAKRSFKMIAFMAQKMVSVALQES